LTWDILTRKNKQKLKEASHLAEMYKQKLEEASGLTETYKSKLKEKSQEDSQIEDIRSAISYRESIKKHE
jgi:hypothetical protein